MATQSEIITLRDGVTAQAVSVPPDTSVDALARLMAPLALPAVQGAVALVGGAAVLDTDSSPEERSAAQSVITALAAIAQAHRLAVIDGGTNAGVMRIMGQARHAVGAGFPLIGVAPRGKVTWMGRAADDLPAGDTPLEAHHSHFLLVEAAQWGTESGVLAKAAYALDDQPLEFVVNGGQVTAEHDVPLFVELGGMVVVVAGSGRYADVIAAAVTQGRTDEAALKPLLASGRVRVLPANRIAEAEQPPQALWDWLSAHVR